jgi:hypothetical protein
MKHYTLNTGRTRTSPRHEVNHEIIKKLQPIIEIGGLIPGTDIELTLTRFEGGVLFTLWQGLPIINGAVAWTKEGAQEVWENLAGIYQDICCNSPIVEPAKQPIELPWLSTIILPPIINQDPKNVGIRVSLERNIAWAIIEMENRPPNSIFEPKLLTQTGKMIPIIPQHGRSFTLAELKTYVGGGIEILQANGKSREILVINNDHRRTPGLVKNELATIAWHDICTLEAIHSHDDIIGNAVLCHTTQVH